MKPTVTIAGEKRNKGEDTVYNLANCFNEHVVKKLWCVGVSKFMGDREGRKW
jgi:hypothetical protein